ncbi:DUF5134 domain-containing protein [Mycobacterium lacus]|uniref:Uncharacterized protein n=1 Tax=Mycobacterium lacus TaxID=169765 RepID=A0A1X1YAD9_9MYCO|nr:DUF5134 domain-containing protein [Mycobacterium lacus]MCV7122498.1 DUF5134 domain-containing protein [Mycobacterium lacus]ORW07991.1 hypothetical protein AWC15_19140 [Mycobacterium lacus]BBX96591.1 hypothetical protein MLAC_18850 [Mycobacterium lacus]
MIGDVLLRWAITGLFVLSAAVSGFAIRAEGRPWTSAIDGDRMAVMAWPWATHLPAAGPAVFFLPAAGWFVTMAAGMAIMFGAILFHA